VFVANVSGFSIFIKLELKHLFFLLLALLKIFLFAKHQTEKPFPEIHEIRSLMKVQLPAVFQALYF